MKDTLYSRRQLGRRCLGAAVAILALCASGARAWETKAQALEQAVSLVHDPNVFGVSSLSTRYPPDHAVTELADHVITGPEYYSLCDPEEGSLLYLGLTVSQTWRNVLHSESRNATVSIASNADPSLPDPRHSSKHHPDRWQDHRPSWRRGMPSKPRITLFGHFDILNVTQEPREAEKASQCYLEQHKDASHWAPNSTESPHVPFWATFNVDKVYWVGGFGDEHYIGWFTSDEWSTAFKRHRLSDTLPQPVQGIPQLAFQ
ncbi:hypothetical protein PANT_14d00043 [Moesziomyces antarcticus T-34]|uniref:CREG-like beta-barrel domain-containing protein n=1 Tax=Pseudozyma antarctica (strain T-34) TaxID=1151754 RepID=M9LX79_PSEA3|nr:hypothetical protein PANT_14d00043 [Moesziomyces antarcticus T-34]